MHILKYEFRLVKHCGVVQSARMSLSESEDKGSSPYTAAYEDVMRFVPLGIQVDEANNFWCYIVDIRHYFPSAGINPGVQYINNVAGYHAGDKIELAGYRWTIEECRVMGYQFSFKRITLNHGVPIQS